MKTLTLILVVTASALSQPAIKSSTVLPLPDDRQWLSPRFSRDGSAIYLTTAGYNGIWRYDIEENQLRELTRDPGAGYGFSFSNDGKTLAYRRTLVHENSIERTQEIVRLNVETGERHVIASGPTLSTPTILGTEIVYSFGDSIVGVNRIGANEKTLAGIEKTKIAVLENGTMKILDPIPNGSYIWPGLSPDGKSLAAFEISRGLFVSDSDGKNLRFLGRYNAPAWTHDGKWVVMMNDKDDGHQLISSDLVAVSVNGGEMTPLTSSNDIIEIYPQCSPVDNRIVCGTADGHIILLTYTIEGEE